MKFNKDFFEDLFYRAFLVFSILLLIFLLISSIQGFTELIKGKSTGVLTFYCLITIFMIIKLVNIGKDLVTRVLNSHSPLKRTSHIKKKEVKS
jgi:hypothetical protein